MKFQEMKPGGAYEGDFLIINISEALSSKGDYYLHLVLSDGEQKEKCILFDMQKRLFPYKEGSVVHCRMTVSEHKGNTVYTIRKTEDAPKDVDPTQFLQHAPYSTDNMKEWIYQITSDSIRQLYEENPVDRAYLSPDLYAGSFLYHAMRGTYAAHLLDNLYQKTKNEESASLAKKVAGHLAKVFGADPDGTITGTAVELALTQPLAGLAKMAGEMTPVMKNAAFSAVDLARPLTKEAEIVRFAVRVPLTAYYMENLTDLMAIVNIGCVRAYTNELLSCEETEDGRLMTVIPLSMQILADTLPEYAETIGKAYAKREDNTLLLRELNYLTQRMIRFDAAYPTMKSGTFAPKMYKP